MSHADARPVVALLQDGDAFDEPVVSGVRASSRGPSGLMGRHVAGRTFLEAYLRHGTFSELAVLARERSFAQPVIDAWRQHAPAREPGTIRRLRVLERGNFHREFFPEPPATLIHAPQPPDPALAWARQQGGPHAYALSGVTHTLASAGAVALLRELVTAPFEPYDALVCTSRAVVAMVEQVAGTFAEYLARRLGAPAMQDRRPLRLEVIPLGVDTGTYRPAGEAERVEARRRFGVPEDAVVALFVGRLSHHAKAHPFPLYQGLAQAARATGRPVWLLMAGWTAHEAVRAAFEDGARRLAPGVRVALIDGTEPVNRRAVWQAADLFVSLADSVQETFGLSVVEAMASGLPVVASDWDGYRDLVVDGETGRLVPTLGVTGAGASATARLLTGETNYDHFLAECGQATTVDQAATTAALSELVADAELRRKLGEAGRRRAVERFEWSHVIRAYEALWASQEAERRDRALFDQGSCPASAIVAPAAYPPVERTFAAYPTRWLDGQTRVEAVPGAGDSLEPLLTTPLTNHLAGLRASDPALLRHVLEAGVKSLTELDALWARAGVPHEAGRATVAWMLKYGLIRPVSAPGSQD